MLTMPINRCASWRGHLDSRSIELSHQSETDRWLSRCRIKDGDSSFKGSDSGGQSIGKEFRSKVTFLADEASHSGLTSTLWLDFLGYIRG